MSEITISLEQVEAYIKTLSGEYHSSYSPEYDLYSAGLISFLQDVDRGFGDAADALLTAHAIKADKLEEARQDEVNSYNEKRLIAENKCTMVNFGEAPIKIEGERCIL